MAAIKEESEDMEFIKEESEDMKIEEVFSVKKEEMEEQTGWFFIFTAELSHLIFIKGSSTTE